MDNSKRTEFIKRLGIDGSSLMEPFSYDVISEVKESITKPRYIKFGDVTAFRKDSRMIDDSDDIEMVINWIGRK